MDSPQKLMKILKTVIGTMKEPKTLCFTETIKMNSMRVENMFTAKSY